MEKKGLLAEFKDFLARGNALDLAVGVVIGGAFNAVVTAIVEALISDQRRHRLFRMETGTLPCR